MGDVVVDSKGSLESLPSRYVMIMIDECEFSSISWNGKIMELDGKYRDAQSYQEKHFTDYESMKQIMCNSA